MKTFIASLLLLVLPQTMEFQKSFFSGNKVHVQGKVVNADTQQALVGATINILEANEHKTTDSNGNFELFVNPGSYSFEVSSAGFKTYSKQILVTESGLKNLVIALDPVVQVEVYSEEVLNIIAPLNLHQQEA